MFIIFLLTLCFGSLTLESAQSALLMWFEKLVPSMFVSMVLVRLLYKENIFQLLPTFGLPALLAMDKQAWTLVLCTMFLGFPSGSLFLDEAVRDHILTQKDGQRLLYCCCFPTPGFVVLSVGIVFFQSLRTGMLLYGIQLASGVLLLLFTRHHRIHTNTITTPQTASFMHHVSLAIRESGISLYMIGGYLMLFMSVTAILFSFLPEHVSLLLRSLSEFSSGIILVNTSPISRFQRQLFTCFLLGFAGFCVHMQITSMVEYIPIHYLQFLMFRLLQGVLSVLLFLLYVQFF